MKIEYRTPAGSGAYSVLADDGNSTGLGDRISGWLPELTKDPTGVKLAGGGLFTADHTTGSFDPSFSVFRTHADDAAAMLFLVSHPLIFCVPATFDLKVTQGSTVAYVVNCALRSFRPNEFSGKSTFCKYAFVFGTYTTTAP